ncbi:hypothetical protein ACI3KS_07945 [Microbacterium sp. ZW T5_45]|uniref:hypothetical protein n=1 Tax=Microbacterium sp. ZW T5_45 TaxID=3378080 RepID=UPI003851DA99
MDTEQFDALLDASAPAPRVVDRADVRAMMTAAAEAAEAAEPPDTWRPRRRVRISLAAAAAVALMIGGGGVAVASGLVSWPSGYEDPDGSYAFTLPSGRACEVRLVVEDQTASDEDAGADDATTRAVQDALTSWLREGALERDLDLQEADAEAARILAEQRAVGMTVLIGADGWLTDEAIAPGRPDDDDARAFAVDRAVRAALADRLVDAGFPPQTWTVSAEGGVKCEAE